MHTIKLIHKQLCIWNVTFNNYDEMYEFIKKS